MASEIRVNKIANRAGLSTVEYTDTGIIVSGIVTCTEISGLNALNIAGVSTFASPLDINGDIDVDGHTNLDNLSVAGVSTFSNIVNVVNNIQFTSSSGNISGTTAIFDDFLNVGSNIKLGNAGVITATSFVGSGAALTGIDATAIKDSGGNVKIQAQASGAIHTGVSTFNQINLEDDKYLKLGTGNDLQFYHLASDNNSYIKETGSGSLMIQGDVVNIGSPTSGEYYIRAFENADVQIRYNNSTKIQTTNTGAVVTGILTATSFSGDGSSLSNLPAGAPVGGASTNTVFFENDKAVAVNYQVTSTKNAMSAGPIAINAGIAVTVPSGCAWTIV